MYATFATSHIHLTLLLKLRHKTSRQRCSALPHSLFALIKAETIIEKLHTAYEHYERYEHNSIGA